MIVVYLQVSNFTAISSREQVAFRRNVDDVRYSTKSTRFVFIVLAGLLKQQSKGWRVAPYRHTISDFGPTSIRSCPLMLFLWFDHTSVGTNDLAHLRRAR